MGQLWGKATAALLAVILLFSGTAPLRAADILQCVPYARAVSGLALYGDAWTWWDQAAGHYQRGHTPKMGAVLAFQPYGPMQLGHVAVVSKLLSPRQVLIRHANWSAPGAIEEDVLAVDVSDDGDWSEVRVWFTPTGQMGARINPTFGFIYPRHPQLAPFTGGSGQRMTQTVAYSPRIEMQPLARRLADMVPERRRAALDYADMTGGDDVWAGSGQAAGAARSAATGRKLSDIIADVKREAKLR